MLFYNKYMNYGRSKEKITVEFFFKNVHAEKAMIFPKKREICRGDFARLCSIGRQELFSVLLKLTRVSVQSAISLCDRKKSIKTNGKFRG